MPAELLNDLFECDLANSLARVTVEEETYPIIAINPNTSAMSQEFVDAVFSDECGFYQLSERLFVVNGWDDKTNTALVST
jgi:hypothetical protein